MTETVLGRSDPPWSRLKAVHAGPSASAASAASAAAGDGVRYRPLGAFRLVLALCVVFQHFGNLAPERFRAAGLRFDVGTLAVLVFFVLSGLVITEAAHRFYGDRPVAFILNRFVRLLPVALLVIVLNTAIWAAFLAPAPVPPARIGLTVLRGILSVFPFSAKGEGFDPLPVAWALRAEFLFYFACFCVLAGKRRFRSGRHHPALVCAALLVLAGLFMTDVLGGRSTLLGFIPHFVLGGAVYFAGAGGRRWRWAVRGVAALAAAGVMVQFFAAPDGFGGPVLRGDRLPQAAILAAMLGTALVLSTRRAAGRAARIDRRWGDLSYPAYMGHYTVEMVCLALLPRGAATYVAAWPAALLTAAVLWKVGEQPIGLLRNRIRGRAIR